MTDIKKNKRINRVNIVIAVLIAFFSWFYVVSEVNPTVTRSYSDIPITCVGLDKLADRGLGIESMSATETKIKVRIARTDILDTDASDFSAVIDVSSAVNGDNTLEVKVSTPDGSSVKDQNVENVTIKVTSSLNKDVPVTATYSNTQDKSMEPVVLTRDTEMVSVMGAKSQVEKVAYVALAAQTISAAGTEDNNYEKDIIGKPVAMTADGEVVHNIVIRPETVDITYSAGSVKTAKLELTVKGEEWLKDNDLKTSIPDTVDIKGAAKVIGAIDSITATADVTGLKAGDEAKIEYNLPDGVYIANGSLVNAVKIKK